MLAAESDLLDALERLSSADSDEAWHIAVNERNAALRRLLKAVSDLPLDARELVVTRATQLLTRDRAQLPTDDLHRNGGAR